MQLSDKEFFQPNMEEAMENKDVYLLAGSEAGDNYLICDHRGGGPRGRGGYGVGSLEQESSGTRQPLWQ